MLIVKRFFLLLLACNLFLQTKTYAQLPYNLVDGLESNYCTQCRDILNSQLPPEVKFGIYIGNDGDVYFSMNDKRWFNKIFRADNFGITVDIVPKSRYACGKPTPDWQLIKGTVLPPIFKKDIIKNNESTTDNEVLVRIGKIPTTLINKEAEGNLIILNGNYICSYHWLVDVPRLVWDILPMGLYSDSLINEVREANQEKKDFFTYKKKVQIILPFSKSKADFGNEQFKRAYDSLRLSDYIIRKAEVRAYASIEGNGETNNRLMKQRADTILAALNKHRISPARIKIITAENWVEFYRDINGTPFEELKDFSKTDIKQELQKKGKQDSLEAILAKHRKGIITFYLDSKTENHDTPVDSLVKNFNAYVSNIDVRKAQIIQKEIIDRIIDNRLPIDYLNKLEIPQTKDFTALVNDNEVYRYYLRISDEHEALEKFKALEKIAPKNARIKYNICSLEFFEWKNSGNNYKHTDLKNRISEIVKLGIDSSLTKRMFINYHILKAENDLAALNYSAKDSSLAYIKNAFNTIKKSDEDYFSLAQFYSYYSKAEWALELLQERVGDINVSEDIVFYYINLMFFEPDYSESQEFNNALLNAININPKRFCGFFSSNNKGGASFQLLSNSLLKDLYCETCKGK